MANGKEYEVEKILDQRTKNGKIEYLLKWKRYPASDNSWVSESNLNCPILLNEYRKTKVEIQKVGYGMWILLMKVLSRSL